MQTIAGFAAVRRVLPMDMRDLLRAVRKRWWLVFAFVGVSTLGGALVTANTTPQYATNVTFFVTTTAGRDASDSYQGALFSQQRVKSYADLLSGDRLARAIVDHHGIDLPPAEVQARISANAVLNTVLLEATVTDPS